MNLPDFDYLQLLQFIIQGAGMGPVGLVLILAALLVGAVKLASGPLAGLPFLGFLGTKAWKLALAIVTPVAITVIAVLTGGLVVTPALIAGLLGVIWAAIGMHSSTKNSAEVLKPVPLDGDHAVAKNANLNTIIGVMGPGDGPKE